VKRSVAPQQNICATLAGILKNMYNMKILLLIIVTLLSENAFSQLDKPYKYPNDIVISNFKGEPINEKVFYFPQKMFIDSIDEYLIEQDKNGKTIKESRHWNVGVDSIKMVWFSKVLYNAKEPVLYNYYLNKEIFRFTWIRSFHPEIIIRLEKIGDKVYITEKRNKSIDNSEILPIDTTRQVDLSLWNGFESILKRNNFINMSPTLAFAWGSDGAEWVLEVQKENYYHFVVRWSPNQNQNYDFRNICDFLIDNSIFKKEIRY